MTNADAVPENAPDVGPALVIATSAALLTLIPVAARQLGLIDHLPDPPGSIFASDEIIGSSMAHPLGIPDSLLGIGSYGATLALVLLAHKRPLVRKLLAAKLAADGTAACFNTVRQIAVFRKLCWWCTTTAICTAVVILAGRKLIASEASRL
jgi:uncharacterized membrane protein